MAAVPPAASIESPLCFLLFVAITFAGEAVADGSLTNVATASGVSAMLAAGSDIRLRHVRKDPPAVILTASSERQNLCFDDLSSPDCKAALSTAVGAPTAPRGSFRQSLELNDAHLSTTPSALHFHKHAFWVRRLESIAKEGISFARIPQSRESELVIGINRKGMLGFTLKHKDDEEP